MGTLVMGAEIWHYYFRACGSGFIRFVEDDMSLK